MAGSELHPDYYHNYFEESEQSYPEAVVVDLDHAATAHRESATNLVDDIANPRAVEPELAGGADREREVVGVRIDVSDPHQVIERHLPEPRVLTNRPNRRQYTHTCVCSQRQASTEAKQVSSHNLSKSSAKCHLANFS